MNEAELKPAHATCPFCGKRQANQCMYDSTGLSKRSALREDKFIACFACAASGPRAETFEDAWRLWNERAS